MFKDFNKYLFSVDIGHPRFKSGNVRPQRSSDDRLYHRRG